MGDVKKPAESLSEVWAAAQGVLQGRRYCISRDDPARRRCRFNYGLAA
jgi:hypothetical protein